MKTITIILAALAVTLTGCASATQDRVLQNLEGCERHYQGAVQGGVLGGGFIGSVDITCLPKDAAAPAPPAP